ncbi:MAG: hypothetical protein A2086_00055 [Spirochaetes bacterium GWD1_27_9]|nr:MAG: hypothetical protein A2Z98_17580 [Spirochaetes bacterium GWB1_27_13]OHD21838.1 MAG: hypothetical protein A2Y34_12510 [Spirochaetes bacterium GWC1_27_15]OHD30033.1 MAG: hypothetical protein A2086_00055 [Spirochaetes bacterium GWD1_27_9]
MKKNKIFFIYNFRYKKFDLFKIKCYFKRMEFIKNIFSFLIVAGAIQGIFLSIILFTRKNGNKKANIVLAIILLLFSISITHTLIFINTHFLLPNSTKIGEPFQLLFGQLFYIYVNYLIFPDFKLKPKYLLFLLPFLIFFIFIFAYYTYFFIQNDLTNRIINVIIWIFILINNWTFLILSYRIIIRHQKTIKQNFSNIDKINLEWLKYFIKFLALCYIIYFLLIPILVHQVDPSTHFNKLVIFILSILIYGIGYKSLTQPEIFNGINEIVIIKEIEISSKTSKKYEKSSLSDLEIEEGMKKLEKLIETKKLFKDPELTLSDLAKELDISTHNLSQMINATGTNFFDFINYYRIEEFKNYLKDPKNLEKFTLLSLALDAGFNSKATFNKAFKKNMGMTPSEYLKR